MLILSENKRDFANISSDVLDKLQITLLSDQVNAAFRAMGLGWVHAKETMMREEDWVTSVVGMLQSHLSEQDQSLTASQGQRLPYANEIRTYSIDGPQVHNISYETDILISEHVSASEWKPRVIIEAKLARINTHTAIAYSQKASTHKNVHPYLRYGILIGNRQHYPLPGRLFRHGAYFDFMLSWKALEPSRAELSVLLRLVDAEVKASRDLEEIIYQSRSPNRKRYTCLHRPLRLDQID